MISKPLLSLRLPTLSLALVLPPADVASSSISHASSFHQSLFLLFRHMLSTAASSSLSISATCCP